MQHPGTGTDSSDLHWGVEESTMFMPIPWMTETTLSRNPGIPASKINPASYI